eukprot:11574801-Karenia_brevis.AAC.1
MPQQSYEQAAYKKGFSTEDNLLTVALLVEKSKEWHHPVWIAFLDFETAFDTVEHPALWHALAEQGVEEPYCNYWQGCTRVSLHSCTPRFQVGLFLWRVIL